jgi:hypothetical protein
VLTMPADIQINTNSFGKVSESGDSLMIGLSGSGICFCELNAADNRILFTGCFPFDPNVNTPAHEHLINGLNHFRLSKKNYRNVMVNYFDGHFTLVPVNFYDAANLRALLEFNVGSVADNIIVTDDINAGIKLIYAIDEHLKSSLDSIFPGHQLKHTLSVASRLMLSTDELLKENMLLSIYDDHIEVIVKQDHKLMLANQFSVKTQEDVLYYVLFILEQYQLNPLSVTVTVTGNIESNSSLISSIKKYVKQVRLAKGHKTLNWEAVAGMPQHFHYTLINRLFCE